MTEIIHNDVVKETALQYFDGDTLATDVWMSKYALKNKLGEYLESSPIDTIIRISKEIHRIEQKYPKPLSYETIYNYLKDFKNFIFGGSILFGLGNNDSYSSLGNCFFLDNGIDSYGGVMDLEERMIQLMKRRGGVGITLEHLRPKGALVNNSARSSTGAISFMKRFSNGTREVAQDGRRGALMESMASFHPEIEDFITVKDNLTEITGANISVKAFDDFINAAINDEDYILHWPENLSSNISDEYKSEIKYGDLVPHNEGYIKKIKAKQVWNLIIKQAWKNAEPGVLFWDNIIKESPADMYADVGFQTKGTNPCGEVTLSNADSCRLGSLNIMGVIDNPFTKYAKVDEDKLAYNARLGQRMMDDIIDLEEEKILSIIAKVDSGNEPAKIKAKEIDLWQTVLQVLRNGRRTGLGGLGLGDALAALNIKYATPAATLEVEKIQKIIAINSYKESILLAKERGAFKVFDFDKEINNDFLKRIWNELDSEYKTLWRTYGRRNISNLSYAPTGSLALLAQITSGIESVFKIYYRRRKKVNPGEDGVNVTFIDQNGDNWEEYNVLHRPFVQWVKEILNYEDIKSTESFLSVLKEDKLEELISESPWAGAQANELDYLEKVTMQGKIQKWVDHSISVTHNLPKDITVEEVNEIYLKAWEEGCKGVTIYREGSRSGVLVSINDDTENQEFKETIAPKRDKEAIADYYYAKANGKEFGLIVGLYKNTGRPYEVFAFENPEHKKNTTGKLIKIKRGQYKFVNGEFEIDDVQIATKNIEARALTLMVSMLLRHGAPIKHVNNVIKKIDENIVSFSSVIRRYLSRYDKEDTTEKCPECGGDIIVEDGCKRCSECSYSKCG